MKTTYRRLNSALFSAVLAAIVIIMLPISTQKCWGQGNVSVSIYFGVVQAYGSPGYTASVNNFTQGIENPSLSPVPLILPGSTISATNAFSYPDSTGHQLIVGAHVSDPSGFTLDQAMWVFFSSAWSFTNVFSGASFGTGCVGANGSTTYTSGSTTGVVLTQLWITPGAYSYQLATGETMDQGLQDFLPSLGVSSGSELQVTESVSLNGTISTGSINLQSVPEPSMIPIISVGLIMVLIHTRKRALN